MDPVETIEALGQELFSAFSGIGGMPAAISPVSFRGSIAPLNRAAEILQKTSPGDRFIFILDEFDDLPPEAYRFGALAEAFFSNLRAFSAQPNIAFVLVGGEKMPHVMGAQGDQLNKFAPEPLTYFQRSSEWNDYVRLVVDPIGTPLNVTWSDSALNQLFNATFGHPYYTKLICGRAFSTAVSERDAEITDRDVRHAVRLLASELDSNSFAHIWKDGINADGKEAHVRELQRCRVLLAISKTLRAGETVTTEHIQKHNSSPKLPKHELGPILQECCRRDILRDTHSKLEFVVPLFETWLKEKGVSRLVIDTLAEDLEAELKEAEDSAYVTPSETTDLARRWPIYRGVQISSDQIRAWLEQVRSYREQRLLFKLLQHVRVFSHAEVREYLREAHRLLLPKLPEVVFTKRSDRRKDVLITYVDGAGKSGALFASLYAEENAIDARCVVPPSEVLRTISTMEDQGRYVRAIVIVDDMVGTGQTLADNVQRFTNSLGEDLRRKAISVLVVAITSTHEGARVVREALCQARNVDAQLHVCSPLSDEVYAFPTSGVGFWADERERDLAKALCTELGSRIYRDNPLGFGGLGLLVTFTQTCPNNTLPILHSTSSDWRPLFLRPVN
jgi:hypothetical protein